MLFRVLPRNIQMTILVPFTVVSLVCMLFLGVTLYQQFAARSQQMLTESTEQLLGQTVVNLEDYLRNMRRISDAMYYDVIKDKDLSRDTVDSEMNLLYEANKDNPKCHPNNTRRIANCDRTGFPFTFLPDML